MKHSCPSIAAPQAALPQSPPCMPPTSCPTSQHCREEKGQRKTVNPGPKFPFTVTACGLPTEIGDRIAIDTVRQFVEYYKILGVDR